MTGHRPAFVIVLTVCLLSTASRGADGIAEQAGSAPDEPRTAALEGRVTVAGTGAPVANAAVMVLLEGNAERTRSAITNAEGRYRIAVPMGHLVPWTVQPPPGFRMGDFAYQGLAATPTQPVVHWDYEVLPAISWPLRVVDSATGQPVVGAHVACSSAQGGHTPGTTDAEGRANATTVPEGGDYTVMVLPKSMDIAKLVRASLKAPKGISPAEIALVKPGNEPGDFELSAQSGQTVRVSGFHAVSLADGQLLLELQLPAGKPEPAGPPATIAISGRIVDAARQGLAGASVGLSVGQGQSSAMTDDATTSDADGRFQLDNLPADYATNRDWRLGLVVTAAGYAGVDSRNLRLTLPADDSRVCDVGDITLAPEVTVTLRVLDVNGVPAWGASVEPSRSYAARSQATRTDSQGLCVLHGLSSGIQEASVRFGDQYANSRLVVDGRGEPRDVRLKPLPVETDKRAKAAEPPRAALRAGAVAPELETSAWTDGKPHKLADYRGQVVILDFWGTWCSACLHAAPTLEKLQTKYAPQGVVFLGVHTAGESIDNIRDVQQLKRLPLLTGLDTGAEIADSRTCRAYGVTGFPTLLVIGRDGRVHFTTEEDQGLDQEGVLRRMGEFAKELGIAWPPPDDLPEAEGIEMVNRILELRMSRQIDAALKAEAQP
jgi:thiol-disulfide isomerase/thioredoxin